MSLIGRVQALIFMLSATARSFVRVVLMLLSSVAGTSQSLGAEGSVSDNMLVRKGFANIRCCARGCAPEENLFFRAQARADGIFVEVHGCDLFTFRDGKIALKDSYRKNRPPLGTPTR